MNMGSGYFNLIRPLKNSTRQTNAAIDEQNYGEISRFLLTVLELLPLLKYS